jgi:hypothetical protein
LSHYFFIRQFFFANMADKDTLQSLVDVVTSMKKGFEDKMNLFEDKMNLFDHRLDDIEKRLAESCASAALAKVTTTSTTENSSRASSSSMRGALKEFEIVASAGGGKGGAGKRQKREYPMHSSFSGGVHDEVDGDNDVWPPLEEDKGLALTFYENVFVIGGTGTYAIREKIKAFFTQCVFEKKVGWIVTADPQKYIEFVGVLQEQYGSRVQVQHEESKHFDIQAAAAAAVTAKAASYASGAHGKFSQVRYTGGRTSTSKSYPLEASSTYSRKRPADQQQNYNDFLGNAM